jgi:hypothetical protein
MIEAAAPAGTIIQAFSWPPPQARSARPFGAAADLRPHTTPGRGDGDRKRSRQVIDRLRLLAAHTRPPEALSAGFQWALLVSVLPRGSRIHRAARLQHPLARLGKGESVSAIAKHLEIGRSTLYRALEPHLASGAEN